MKKYLNGLKELSTFAVVAAALISGLISWSVLHAPLQRWAESHVPPAYLTVEVLDEVNPDAIPNHEVWINSLAINGNEDMRALFSDSEQEGFEYRAASEYGYSNDVITCVDGAGSYICFTIRNGGVADHIEFWKQNYSGTVRLTLIQEDTVLTDTTVDLYSDEAGQYFDHSIAVQNKAPFKYVCIRYAAMALVTAVLFAVLTFLLLRLIQSKPQDCDGKGDPRFKSGSADTPQGKRQNDVGNPTVKESPLSSDDCEEPNRVLEKKADAVRKESVRRIAVSIILSLFCAVFIGEDIINALVDRYAPMQLITIEVLDEENELGYVGQEVWITDITPQIYDSLNGYLENAAENTGFEYRRAEDYGYNCDMLTNTAGTAGRLSIMLPAKPETAIHFWPQYLSARIRITAGEAEMFCDLYENLPDQTRIAYPFAANGTLTNAYILAYAVGYALLAALFYVSISRTLYSKKAWWQAITRIPLSRPNKRRFFGFAALCVFAYCVLAYPHLPPTDATIGDTVWYWNAGEALRTESGLSLRNFALHNYGNFTITARGYFIPFYCLLSRKLSLMLSLEEHTVWFLTSALMHAAFSAYVMPGLYEELHGGKPKLHQAFLLFVCYFVFWRGYFVYPTSDFVTCISLFTFLLCILRVLRTGKIGYALLAGVSAFLTINSRQSYILTVGAMLALLVGYRLYKEYRLRYSKNIEQTERVPAGKSFPFVKKYIFLLAVSIAVFVLLCIPQQLINSYQGVLSLVPYDHDGSWFYGERSKGIPMAVSAIYNGLRNTQTIPYFLTNQLGNNALQSLYSGVLRDERFYRLNELVYLYAARLNELTTYTISKILFIINIRSPFYNPPSGIETGLSNLLFTFLNYFIWLSTGMMCFTAWRKALLQKREAGLLIFLLIVFAPPNILVTIEWRYWLPLYTFVYYVFSYLLMGRLLESRELAAEFFSVRRVCAILILMLVLYSASETAYANFFSYFQWVWQ